MHFPLQAEDDGAAVVVVTYVQPLLPLNQILTVADAAGIAVGFGVEITVGWAKKEHHLLGYFPTHLFRAPELTPALTHLQVRHTHTAHAPFA